MFAKHWYIWYIWYISSWPQKLISPRCAKSFSTLSQGTTGVPVLAIQSWPFRSTQVTWPVNRRWNLQGICLENPPVIDDFSRLWPFGAGNSSFHLWFAEAIHTQLSSTNRAFRSERTWPNSKRTWQKKWGFFSNQPQGGTEKWPSSIVLYPVVI